MEDVVAVSRPLGLAILDTDEIATITDWMDGDGEMTHDSENAVVAIASFSGGWLAIDLSQFEPAETH